MKMKELGGGGSEVSGEKNKMIMEEVKHGGGIIGDRKAEPRLNNDKRDGMETIAFCDC